MSALREDTLNWMRSLPISELRLVLSKMPAEKQQTTLLALKELASRESSTERDKDVIRKREQRSESARIEIPECKNPKRREECLQDPERFLVTYFADRYRLGMGKDHRFIIQSIYDRAHTGGRQAIAAPRGRGKSEIVKGMIPYLVLANLVRFPLPIAATTPLAKRLYVDFKKKIATNEMLLEDFPEVCFPVKALEGAPQRAGRQHVDGKLTGIVWAGDYLCLPTVEGSPYGGVKMTYYGLDAAFRGANIDGDRPDFILIDDPETRESAKSIQQIHDREQIIDQDISGLVSQEDNLTMAIITTCQNRYCLSYKLTDPKQKPAYNGRRFGMIVQWPKNSHMWDEYIAKRHAGQSSGDEYGREAVQYYLDNRAEMDEGVEMITEAFVPVTLASGEEMVHSAIQQAYNKIADTSHDAYCTEYQNEPPQEDQIEVMGLSAARVQSRIHRLPQRQAPSTTELRTVGIDIGNRNSHWTDIAWEGNAIGSVVDYGIMETHLEYQADDKAIEVAILASLEVWADEVVEKINPLICLIDSGSGKGHTQAVYEFCRRRGRPFFPSKGWDAGRFRMPPQTDEKVPFVDAWAHKLIKDNVWLYNINTEAWKRWVHQRFLTAAYDDGGNRNDGSLTLFDPGPDKRRHLSFSHHITAEEEQLIPVDGKEMKRVWFVKNRNNHWLDSTALACAGAGCVGVELISATKAPAPRIKKLEPTQPLRDPHGRPFVATNRN
jgi:hypothetical protein